MAVLMGFEVGLWEVTTNDITRHISDGVRWSLVDQEYNIPCFLMLQIHQTEGCPEQGSPLH